MTEFQKIENVCTAVIKTFERPNKLINLLKSIRKFYPRMHVIIIDDSTSCIKHKWDKKTSYYHMPYDIGLSEGRNIGVSYVKTPYTLVLDDDFLFTEKTKLDIFLHILKNYNFDIVSGDVVDYGVMTRSRRGIFKIKEKNLVLKYLPANHKKSGYPNLDFVLNFFLARTNILKYYPWDSDLKIREHEEFFWRLKQNNVRVTYTNEVSIWHFPDDHSEIKKTKYSEMREGRFLHFHKIACTKIGVEDFITDNSSYYGIFDIFKRYQIWVIWMKQEKDKNLLAYLCFIFWHTARWVFKKFIKTLSSIRASIMP
jgi:glycosyltransferase involved in cell wall biosynthesis